MTFKDLIESDISVFLNSDEFGETHNINNVDVTVVIDDDLLEQKSDKRGIYLGDLLFHAKTSDLTFLPLSGNPDQIISFDGEDYRILKVVNNAGISTITLSKDTGDRFIIVKYRIEAGSGGDPDLGKPPVKQSWSEALIINPNPIFDEIKNQFVVNDIGIIRQGDIKLSIDKSNYTREELESYEFLINNAEYSLINGQIIEEAYFWVLYLRRKL